MSEEDIGLSQISTDISDNKDNNVTNDMSDEVSGQELQDFKELILKYAKPELFAKASAAGAYALKDMIVYERESLTPKNVSEWINLYVEHVWAYAGIYAIASTIASLIPQLILLKENGERETLATHPVLSLLRRPNNEWTGYDLLEAAVIYLETCGNAYWEIIKGTKETTVNDKPIQSKTFPMELHSIRPDWISVEPDKEGYGVKQYILQTTKGARRKFLSPDSIVPIRYFHPLKAFYGMGALQPAMDDIMQDQQMATWNYNFFKHGITPEGLLYTDQPMTPFEMKLLGKQIKEFLVGKGRQVLILSKGLKWQTISVNPKDIDFLQGRKENRQAILAALGVPPIKVGLLEHAKYDNYYLQLEAYHRDTIFPKVRKIESALTNFLLPKFEDLDYNKNGGKWYEIDFDKSNLIQEEEDKKVGRFTKLIDYGVLTPNQVAQKLGLPKHDGGDVLLVRNTLTPINMLESSETIEIREDLKKQRLDSLEENLDIRTADLESKLRNVAKA